MEELIRALENTFDNVQIKIQQVGFEFTIYSNIVDISMFADGISLSLENESEIFISSLLNKIIKEEVTDDTTEYTIVTPSKAIITIMIAN